MKIQGDNTQGPSLKLSCCTLISPQIKNESFLEDINNVLNSGDIPNLYSSDEQDQIVNTMRPYIQEQGLQPTKANLMAAYTGRVRSNIHVVLCMRYGQPLWPCRDGPRACHEEGPGLLGVEVSDSFGLLVPQPHRRGLPSPFEAVPLPCQLLYH